MEEASNHFIQTSQNRGTHPRDPPGSSPIFPPPQYCHHSLANPSRRQAGRRAVPIFKERPRPPKRNCIGLNANQPTVPDLLIHSPTHPSPSLKIRWGSKTAAAALVASLPTEQCLGGASTPFTGAAAPSLSPLRTRPSSSRHCFLPRTDTAPARTRMRKRRPKS